MKTMAVTFASICQDRRIEAAYVFGSRMDEVADRLRGRRRESGDSASDVDIGVLLQGETTVDATAKSLLAADLEDLLDVNRVDLIVLSEAPALLALEAIKGELVYDTNPDRTAEYELFVMRRAADLVDFERAAVSQILAGEMQ